MKQAGLLKAARKRESAINFGERPPWEQSEQTAAEAVRPIIIAGQPVDRDQLLALPLGDGSAHHLLPAILAIRQQAPVVKGGRLMKLLKKYSRRILESGQSRLAAARR